MKHFIPSFFTPRLDFLKNISIERWIFLLSGLAIMIGGICLSLGVYVISLVSRQPSAPLTAAPSFPQESPVEAAMPQVMVEVSGAVKKPGVYAFDQEPRISEVLSRAEGFSNQADKTYIAEKLFLAKKIGDGEKIFIPAQGQTGESSVENSLSDSIILVNSASVKELEALPGIGPKKAEEIINKRPYSSLEELQTKLHFSQSLIDQLQPLISF